jgi:60S ribosomal subunit assembly/export protein LOC1
MAPKQNRVTKPSSGPKRTASKSSSSSGPSSKAKKPGKTAPPVKTNKAVKQGTAKSKLPPHKRYKESELKVPQLNGIIPAGVTRPPNQKKGKTFVDDKESMNAIMAVVMAEKEGNLESKMMKTRQLEEVRAAKLAEAEKRVAGKKSEMEDRKANIKTEGKRSKRRRSDREGDNEEGGRSTKKVDDGSKKVKLRKRVSFG